MTKSRIEISYSPGDALIDAELCFHNPQSLKEQFNVPKFLDLCSSIDAVVLHKKLHSYFSDEFNKDQNPLIRSLVSEGVLVSHEELGAITIGNALNDDRVRSILTWNLKQENIKLSTRLDTIFLPLTRILVYFMFEDLLELPLVLNFKQTPFYLLHPDIQHEEEASLLLHKSLAKQYKDLTNKLHFIRSQTDGNEFLRIPPIALEALYLCDNLDDLGYVVLDLRQKYRGIRNLFAELDEIMRSGDISPMEKIKEQYKILKSIDALFNCEEIDDITMLTSFGKNLNDISKFSHLLDMSNPSFINWKGLIDLIIEKGSAAYWKFRLKPLFSTKKRYLQISTNEIYSIIKKHFGYSIAEKDILNVFSYPNEVKELFEPSYESKEEFGKRLDKNKKKLKKKQKKVTDRKIESA